MGDVYKIVFQYNPDIINLVKAVPGRRYVPEGKFWTVPTDRLGFLLKAFEGTQWQQNVHVYSDEQINVNATLDATTVIPDIDVSTIHYHIKEGCKPYQHQIDSLKYCIDRYRKGKKYGFVLGDEMGLGKTASAINIALYNKQYRNYKHCLIICCINTSKYNWESDIREHTRGEYEGYILGTRLKRDKVTKRYDTSTKEKYDDLCTGHMYGDTSAPELPYFIIMNIEALRYRIKKAFPITHKLVELINAGGINMICIDEIHKNTSPSSQQGKQLIDMFDQSTQPVEYIPITGTPIINRPTDVYLPLKLIRAHSFSSYGGWCKKYCIYGGFGNHEVVGYKNIPELKDLLQDNMLRRLKKDVLDLPPKIQKEIYVENTAYQKQLYNIVESEIQSDKDSILSSNNPLAKFMRLRQVNGAPEIVDSDLQVDGKYIQKNAKYKTVMDILEDIHSRGEKVLIYSNWVEPLRTLYKFIATKYKVCCYTGTMAEKDRQRHKQVFMSNPEYTIMVGTIDAMGTSHTLTAANNVIFLDEPWVPGNKAQAEDRVHRISATEPITIYTIITKDTVDDRVHQILYDKNCIAKYIVDDKLDIRNNPELFDYLLGKDQRIKSKQEVIDMDYNITILIAIVIIAYLAGEIAKKSKLDNASIPIVCGVVGGVMGILALYLHVPDFPATDPITAVGVGIAYGLAATGVNQAFHQQKKRNDTAAQEP